MLESRSDTVIQNIRGLIEEWADDISASERIWLRASGSNRKTFMDYDGSIISKGIHLACCQRHHYILTQFPGDERLRTFPFPTRRPVSIVLLDWSLLVTDYTD